MMNDQRQRQREVEWVYIEENDPVLSMQLAVMRVLGESVSGGEIAEERAWMLPAAEDMETFLLDTGERDACVSFCRDRLELFDFADAPEEEARIREILSGAD